MSGETGYLIVLGAVWAGLCLGFIGAVGLFIYRSAAVGDAEARRTGAVADLIADAWRARPAPPAEPDGAPPAPPAARRYRVFAEPPVVPPTRPKEGAPEAEGPAAEASGAQPPEQPAAGSTAS